MAITEELVSEVLDELAEDPYGILRYTDTTGVALDAMACPVASYLNATFPYECVEVGPEVATVGNVKVDMPVKVRWFIARFDSGAHPDLNYAK